MQNKKIKIENSDKSLKIVKRASDIALLTLDIAGESLVKTFWPHPYFHTLCEHKNKKSIYKTLQRLGDKGLVYGEKRGKQAVYGLTDEGEKAVERLKIKYASSDTNWDGKWRILIFDVPEKTRGKRDFFRKELVEFGFKQLQKSVWVTPQEIPKDFIKIWEDLLISESIVFFETSNISNVKKLEKLFNLA